MSTANRFGRIVSPGMVERAVVATLNVWMDDCLGELERLEGYAPGSIERPRGIVTRSEFERRQEDQVPLLVVINTGVNGKPERRGGGVYRLAWAVGVVAIVSDTDEDATRDLASAYTTAVRVALLQHAKLKSGSFPDGLADDLDLLDEQYNDIPFLSTRNLASGRVTVEIGVDSAVSMLAGPTVPSGHPSTDPGPWPSAVQPSTNVVPLSILETV